MIKTFERIGGVKILRNMAISQIFLEKVSNGIKLVIWVYDYGGYTEGIWCFLSSDFSYFKIHPLGNDHSPFFNYNRVYDFENAIKILVGYMIENDLQHVDFAEFLKLFSKNRYSGFMNYLYDIENDPSLKNIIELCQNTDNYINETKISKAEAAYEADMVFIPKQ